MMGGRTPKTCSAANKRQDNKLEKLMHLVGNLFELSAIFYMFLTVHLRIILVADQLDAQFLL